MREGGSLKEMIRQLKVVSENIKIAKGKNIVLVVGPTGSGKSSIINGLQGRKLIANEKLNENGNSTGEKIVKTVNDGYGGPEIGHRSSHTKIPEIYEQVDLKKDDTDQFFYCDTIGLFDLRNKAYQANAIHAIQLAVESASAIKGLVIIIEYSSLLSTRSIIFIETIKTLAKALGSIRTGFFIK